MGTSSLRTGGWVGVALSVACALDPTSTELLVARTLYRQAMASGTAEFAPAEMYEAGLALEAAERENSLTPGDPNEAELAYLARRKTIAAMRAADERARARR